MTKTAKLYGGSLYDLAAEEKVTDSMLEELSMVQGILKENPEYLTLLAEPSIPKAERVKLLDDAFGGKIHAYLLNFIKLLCENGMLRELNDCCREFKARYNEDHNIAEAVVTSAVALDKEQAEALKAKLAAMSNKTIVLTQKVDSHVLGGLKVELEGKQLDGTAQGRLSGLRKKVTEIIV
ncbi:ATP synthase F1 subunit delta [Lacrimispora sp. 210928-DFI.3.58]|uniref:ATP synthase F1 subunit delta n=1 Tax=Lacrimispora sp. 210928-DFI.3.58 TaxID=2883214 RepID=UPI0015B7537E|nr:ATP synthase F1 subunit delta [Lacrimispora sp. 210928-DFI.3.58]MCB7320219.1 ATP synthase F1 subunit delta [Lacrimispora sp. 210928-DFI.3.58]